MDLKKLFVFVYRNLHLKKKGVFYSLRNIESGLVFDRRQHIVIKNPLFKVSKAGQERVRRERSKNVHAGIQGQLISKLPASANGLKKVSFTYNPYEYDGFTTSRGKILQEAKYVVLSPEGSYAYL